MSKTADRCETVFVTPDADRLATRYIEAGAVSEAFLADAYHIAIAVVCGADVIVSWNFRHIVRRKTRDIVNMPSFAAERLGSVPMDMPAAVTYLPS